MKQRFGLWCCASLVLALNLSASEPPKDNTPLPKKVDFNRDIRQLIANNCFHCHGPDKESRQAQLRLDIREDAIADNGGTAAIVPGKPDASALIQHINSTDPEEVMPPPKTGHKLSDREKAILKLWIQQGAPYAEHWSFVKPVKAPLPKIKNKKWAKNGIDYFIAERLEREGLKPSPDADRYALIRRVSLDLTGLPPMPREVQDFVNDKSENAYEKVVDRLLASPHYGERWARMWLDLARYADSAGYGSDPLRMNIWPYRDWLIDAFNRNLPYDQFSTEQLAGDLLPNATKEQILATAFHRNTMTNTEGGTDDEEFRVAAVKDRANVTAQVWMGLTLGCAQCHSHKFDPISQKEYYQFYGFFNQTEDNDRGDEAPTMPVPTKEQDEKRATINAKIAELEGKLNADTPEFTAAQKKWEETEGTQTVPWRVLEPAEIVSAKGTVLTKQADNSILASGKHPDTDTYTVKVNGDVNGITAVRLEVLTDDSLPGKGPGRAGGNFVLSDFKVQVSPPKPTGLKGRFVRVELPGAGRMLHLAEVQAFAAGVNVAQKGKATQSSTDYGGPPERGNDGTTNGEFGGNSVTHTKIEDNPWWEVDLGATVELDSVSIWNRTDNNLQTRMNNFKLLVLGEDRKPVYEQTYKEAPQKNLDVPLSGARPVPLHNATADHSQPDYAVTEALDNDTKPQSGWAIGPQMGKAHAAVFETKTPVKFDGPAQLTFTLQQTLNQHTIGKFRLSVTSKAPPVREYPQNIVAALAVPADKRADAQKTDLKTYYRSIGKEFDALRKEIADQKTALTKITPPNVPVMKELAADKKRTTKILAKGNFLTPGDAVETAALAKFHAYPAGQPVNRLGLAQWLMSRENPLTARVAANRFWAQLFGAGIVLTEEDFGTQGMLPSHPELLDWMAVEFMDLQWDMKKFLKLVVTSATYQQSSRVTPELLEKDPFGRLLSRSPRRRLDAEGVRDVALTLSGLLSNKIGGPSVYPPQPDGLWRAAFNGERAYPTSTGEDKFRRGVYTFWRRTIPYPSMATFDAPSREICTIRRISTNTPLQAFVTMNDPVYVECAQALGRRIVKEGGASVEARVKFGLELCLARPARPEQVQSLVTLFNEEVANFKKNADAAKKLATEPIGPLPEGMDAAEQAAWTVVGNVLLNLDGVLSKG